MSIVITGNPGVGKHTITDEIVKRLKLDLLDINSIAKESGLFEKNRETNDVDIEELEKILDQKISEKNVIVGHLAPYVLKKNQVKTMIVLRRSPYELIQVYSTREYSDQKIKENTGSEILGIIAHDAISKFQEKVFQINVTEKTISKVVENVMEVITKNNGNEEVDWLELVRKNNDLGKFFVD
ncbi:shikimate kinase [Nitrosopumilus cobalaminigenes]|uniref:Shikimate kinase n=1 Tax=Nitrosopumilus cobalaminigenes TaxID=1470066 RepID=A0A7D5LZY3_9ARCH|nr:AAA family ATPase [Nitrosopumilus cobalaminigenes]QLH03493.1 shikimate kinase [Nitrosopumilus cobalaminigenes]